MSKQVYHQGGYVEVDADHTGPVEADEIVTDRRLARTAKVPQAGGTSEAAVGPGGDDETPAGTETTEDGQGGQDDGTTPEPGAEDGTAEGDGAAVDQDDETKDQADAEGDGTE